MLNIWFCETFNISSCKNINSTIKWILMKIIRPKTSDFEYGLKLIIIKVQMKNINTLYLNFRLNKTESNARMLNIK